MIATGSDGRLMRRFLFGRPGPEVKAIRKTVGPPQNVWDRHTFIFALNRHIGFISIFCLPEPTQSTMLTIIADKLSAASFSWDYRSAVTRGGWRWGGWLSPR
jgi:hypothetical protein